MTLPTRDWLSFDGAHELASIIKRYWAARGREIEVEVVSSSVGRNHHSAYGVRSNLVFFAPEKAP